VSPSPRTGDAPGFYPRQRPLPVRVDARQRTGIEGTAYVSTSSSFFGSSRKFSFYLKRISVLSDDMYSHCTPTQLYIITSSSFRIIFAAAAACNVTATPHKMITTSVRGHLASQDFPPTYGWSKCDPKVLFDAPIETMYRDDVVNLERQLGQLSRQCNVLILWLDCDREGEAIGEEVREVCVGANPNLHVYRARFSNVMAPEIKRALQSLGRLNQNFVDAVQARSELDLRVGAAFTRFQTLRLQRRFDGFSEQGVVSYGPCQVSRNPKPFLFLRFSQTNLIKLTAPPFFADLVISSPRWDSSWSAGRELKPFDRKNFGFWTCQYGWTRTETPRGRGRQIMDPRPEMATTTITITTTTTVPGGGRFTLRGRERDCTIAT